MTTPRRWNGRGLGMSTNCVSGGVAACRRPGALDRSTYRVTSTFPTLSRRSGSGRVVGASFSTITKRASPPARVSWTVRFRFSFAGFRVRAFLPALPSAPAQPSPSFPDSCRTFTSRS